MISHFIIIGFIFKAWRKLSKHFPGLVWTNMDSGKSWLWGKRHPRRDLWTFYRLQCTDALRNQIPLWRWDLGQWCKQTLKCLFLSQNECFSGSQMRIREWCDSTKHYKFLSSDFNLRLVTMIEVMIVIEQEVNFTDFPVVTFGHADSSDLGFLSRVS